MLPKNSKATTPARMTELILNLTNTANVRGTSATPDSVQRFSVYDFIAVVWPSADKKNSTSRKRFQTLVQDGADHKDELLGLCMSIKFAGHGQRETPAMTIRGLQRLLMILGGKVAAEFRALIETTFTRVLAGDTSLIETINANAASDGPVQKLCREALESSPPASPESSIGKKRKADVAELEARQRIEGTRLQMLTQAVDLHERIATAYLLMCPNGIIDERGRMMLKDNLANNVMSVHMATDGAGVLQLENGEPLINNNTHISISNVAFEMGHLFNTKELKEIGLIASDKYFELYKKRPPKHWQESAGNLQVPVNTYFKEHKKMIQDIISNYKKPKPAKPEVPMCFRPRRST
jgi:hypothetical protein